MSLPVAALVALLAGQQPAERQLKFAAVDIEAVGVSKELVSFLTDHQADQFAAAGLKVTTSKEVAAILGLERQKQLLGCSDESSSCAAELANALGVDGLIMTDIAKVGTVFKVNVKVLSSTTAERVASFSMRAESEEKLLDVFSAAAAKLAPELKEKMLKPKPAETTPVVAEREAKPVEAQPEQVEARASGPSPLRYAPLVLGGVALAAGGVFYVLAKGTEAQIQSAPFADREALFAASANGRTQQTVAFALLGAGAAAAGIGAAMLLSGGDDAPEVSVVATPYAAAASVRVSF